MIRSASPDTALMVLDDQAGEARQEVAAHAGADGLINLAQDWRMVGEAVLAAAEQPGTGRAVGDAITVLSRAPICSSCLEEELAARPSWCSRSTTSGRLPAAMPTATWTR